MALKLEDKKLLVREVNAVAEESISAVAAEYRGLSVADMSELRVEARNSGVYIRKHHTQIQHKKENSNE